MTDTVNKTYVAQKLRLWYYIADDNSIYTPQYC